MTDLIEAIDAFATALLERAKAGDTVPTEDQPDRRIPSLREQTETFEAVCKWAELRKKIGGGQPAPVQTESGFGKLKRQYNGASRGRRRTSADTEDDVAAPVGSA